jgi:cytoskeletal protein RodZ
MDPGGMLRAAREEQGLSIEELARRTKITVRVLDALERTDFSILPPPVFVRGFLRTYAREVGLDPDPTVDAYMGTMPSATSTPTGTDPARRAFAPDLSFLSDGGSPRSVIGALILAGVALAIAGYVSLNRTGETPVPGEASSERVVAAAGDSEAAREPLVGTAGASLPPNQSLTLDVHPTGPCWVEVRVDGELRVYRLMQAGERERITAQGALLLRVGDPTVFDYAINGRPGKPLGITSRPVTARLNLDNLPQYVD